MRNITPGFKDYANITVHAITVVDGVRFMMTSDGYDIMYEHADRYIVPADMLGMMLGIETFSYEIEKADLEARPLDDDEVKGMREYVDMFKDFIDPVWYAASRRL